MVQVKDYDISTRYHAVLRKSERITPVNTDEVRELVLDVQEPSFHHQLGQSIGVFTPGPHVFGQPHHLRLYTIADAPRPRQLTICVRRCNYVDAYSGEVYRGVASNYLCDLKPGQTVVFSGPYGHAFSVPADKASDLVMIGMGTGIAPFRAFIKHIYQQLGGWNGRVRLFYGALTGLEMLYMNDERDDIALYYDERTFRAIRMVSNKPHRGEAVDIAGGLHRHEEQVWEMVQAPHCHVYIAGMSIIAEMLDKAFSEMAGSMQTWQRHKASLLAGGRWHELLYA